MDVADWGELAEATPLTNWDSLAVISIIIGIDEVCDRSVSGQALAECCTVGDVLKLAEAS